MHLIILTQYYPPEIGAPQARLSGFARQLIEQGHQVTVLTAMPNYPTGRIFEGYRKLWCREMQDGVNVIRSFIYPTQDAGLIKRLTNYFSFVFSSAFVGGVLLKKGDYLLVESPPLFLGLAGIWLSFLKRARLIFNVSDLWPESAVELGVLRKNSLAHRLSNWLEVFCYRRAWLVSGQSKSILDSISTRCPASRTYHFSNGVDTSIFYPSAGNPKTRKVLAEADEVIVFYAGLHGLAQGLEQIIEAAEKLKEHAIFQFVFFGDGPEKKKLQKLTDEKGLTNVQFHDPRPRTEIPALLASSDIALVPLKKYIPGAVPSKLYEAMASGRPVILIAEGEAADIVEKSEAGIIVQPGDISGLAQAVETLSDPDLRNQLGANARRAAVNCFDRKNIISRFIVFLEEALT